MSATPGHVDERLGRGHGRLVVVAEPVVRQSHSVRAVCDEQVRTEISRVHSENYGVYGIRKVHAQLGREGAVCTADPSPAAPWRG